MNTAVNILFHIAEAVTELSQWSDQPEVGMCYRLALIIFYMHTYNPLKLVMLNVENFQAMSNMAIGAYAAQWCGISTQQIIGSLIKLSSYIQPISVKKETAQM